MRLHMEKPRVQPTPPDRCKNASQTDPGSRCLLEVPRPPPCAMPRKCNRTFASCCSMHNTTSLYDALGRRLSLTPGAREAFLRTTLGHNRLSMISAHRAP
jgi:hypothetical protein